MAHVLAFRFSAFGDVAMTVPVVYSFAVQYPQHQITVVSREAYAPLFGHLPDNVRFYGVNLDDYRGIRGLNKLYKELRAIPFSHVADWHNVLRTRFLRLRLRIDTFPVAVIRKGRGEKRSLTRRHHKKFRPLKTSFARYADVLAELGFPVRLSYRPQHPDLPAGLYGSLPALAGGKQAGQHWIGIAPFAKHPGKIYPTELMEQVIEGLSQQPDVRILLFGGGRSEKDLCETWAARYQRVTSLVGKLRTADELYLISQLDVMLSMDSANMHLASLVGTRVLSVWGATHPYAGFMGWGQAEADAIQLPLACRPCSVFGKKKCYRHDYACLRQISPQTLVERLMQTLAKPPLPQTSLS